MKRLLILFLVISSVYTVYGNESKRAYQTDKITFLGLDYTSVLLVGRDAFRDPVGIKRLTGSWNELLMTEYSKYSVEKSFWVDTKYNLEIVYKRNQSIEYEERIVGFETSSPHLKRENLDSIIASYPDFNDEGVAMVMIVDTYKKIEEKGYYHMVFFDMKTKKILDTYLVSGNAAGFGVRNYWARTAKNAIKKGGRIYRRNQRKYD